MTGTSPSSAEAPNEGWVQRQTSTPDARRQYEAERLAAWAADLIARAMDEQGLSKADVAAKLGKSRAFVTQVLSGQRNLTLRTFADLAWACGGRVVVSAEPLRHGAFVSQSVCLIRKTKPRLVAHVTDAEVETGHTQNFKDLVA